LFQNGTWRPYAGGEALLLAAVLFVIAAVVASLGARLRRPVGVSRPGQAVGVLLVIMWGLSLATFGVAVATYGRAFSQYYGNVTLPPDPVSSITFLSGLVTFIVIAYFTRQHGLKVALGSAVVGSIAAPFIFELPFDLIVMGRTYPPPPETLYTLLFFLPLFLLEISSFSLLTLSPLTKVSRLTLFSLAAVAVVFAVWALFGFSYPLHPLPFAFNAISKILCFVVSITLFLRHEAAEARPVS
jgi:hypothetical protein